MLNCLIPPSITFTMKVNSKVNSIDYRGCALSAARSKIAYLSYEEVKELWSSGGINYIFEGVVNEPKYYEDAASGLNAYSWLQGRTLHFVFRGTSCATDVKIDIDQRRVQLFPDNPSILVHSGFCKQLRAIQSQMLMEIEQLTSMIDVVHFSGHSLGGAVATLAAGAAAAASVKVICHTIGSPRVGNKAFIKWWSTRVSESARIQNFKDPIPLFPVNGFYTHVHGAIEINETGAVTITGDVPWYYRFLRLPFEIYWRNPFANHACDLYIERLMKLAGLQLEVLV